MSIGSSIQVQHALSYVDELLANFSLHPTKSSQFVFQRLLITCGTGWLSVSRHAANCLLSSLGVPELPFNKNALLTESDAAKIVVLVLKFATQVQSNRSTREVKGATCLFNSLVDICSTILETTKRKCIQTGFLQGIVTVLSKFCFLSSDPAQQVAFLCSLNIREVSPVLENFVQGPLQAFFEQFSTGEEKCPLRIEFISRILTYLIKSSFGTVTYTEVCHFVNSVISDVSRSVKEKKAIQPFLFLLLAKRKSVNFGVSIDTLLNQATAVLDKGFGDIATAKDIIMNINRSTLSILFTNSRFLCTESLDSCIDFLECRQMTAELFNEEAVADAIIHFANAWNAREINDSSLEKKFVAIVKHFNSECDWCKVFDRLDAPELIITSRLQLEIVMHTMSEGLKGKAFPTKKLYDVWKNPVAQLSLLSSITQNPDIFCLANHPHHPVHLNTLKTYQDDSDKYVSNWRCGDLTSTLISIENARRSLRSTVLKIFELGINLCPDIVLLGLFQFQPPYTEFHRDLIKNILLRMIPSHPNIVPVLSTGWNLNAVFAGALRSLITEVFVLYYQQDPSDFKHITRILDLAHELKPNGLTSLVNSDKLEFSLLLACLASRRDYLNLDKWLEDKKIERKHELFNAIFTVLRCRAPCTVISSNKPINPLPEDVCNSLMRFCHAHSAEGVPLEFRDALDRMDISNTPVIVSLIL